MKKLLLTTLAFCAFSAFAYNFEEGGIYYNVLDSNARTVETTYKNQNSSGYSSPYEGDIVIPSTVVHDGISYTVTRVGSYTFSGCANVTSVFVPSTVQEIGQHSLSAFTTTKTAYSSTVTYNSMLKHITIEEPSSLYKIGQYAFSSDVALESFTIPAGVTIVNENAFYNCQSLSHLICLSYAPIPLNSAVFSTKYTTAVYVLPESVTAYSNSTNWSSLQVLPVQLEFKTSVASFPKGSEVQVSMVKVPSDLPLLWDSSNPQVATSDSEGHIAAVGEGETSITATIPQTSMSQMCTAYITNSVSGSIPRQKGDVNGDGEVSISDVNHLIDILLYKYESVDLGLPSGTLWATCNIGANSPEEYGDYFAWGETVPKTTYNWSTYKYCNGSGPTLTKYNTNSSYGTVDNKKELELNDDAAYVNWGAAWQIPSKEQEKELRTGCTWAWTSLNGRNGYTITGPNGKSIFLPAGGIISGTSNVDEGSNGLFWTNDSYDRAAGSLGFSSTEIYSGSNSNGSHYYRWVGIPIRPVRVSTSK